jgi:hypothetical protein
MARLTTIADSTTAGSAGAASDAFTRNSITAAGTGALIGLGTGSVLITAYLLPIQTFATVGVAGAAIVIGNRLEDGKSINPFAKKDETPAPSAPAAVPTAA